MRLGDQLERVRRFLRDPNGNIWDRSLLVNIYNDTQKDLQNRTEFLEDVTVLSIPPFYQCAYLYDWEWSYLEGSKFYQALNYHQQGDFVFCHLFEPQVDYALSSDANDYGAHITQPWEAWAGLDVGELIKIRFPENFHTCQLLAYDQEPLEFVRRKDITRHDSSYINYQGEPRYYWRENDVDNTFVVYPRPTTVEWNDVVEQVDPDFIYTHDWEETGYLLTTGGDWTRTDSDNEREYVHLWESDIGSATDYGMRGMYLFEAGFNSSGQYGMIAYTSDTEDEPVGTIERITGSIFSSEEGIAVEVLDDTNNLLLVYDVVPTELVFDVDESDFPTFLRKYIEHEVISRAYGANTDGRIQTLSEYWKYRYETGIKLINKYMSKRREDRDYRLSTFDVGARRSKRHPRLPSSYPAV